MVPAPQQHESGLRLPACSALPLSELLLNVSDAKSLRDALARPFCFKPSDIYSIVALGDCERIVTGDWNDHRIESIFLLSVIRERLNAGGFGDAAAKVDAAALVFTERPGPEIFAHAALWKAADAVIKAIGRLPDWERVKEEAEKIIADILTAVREAECLPQALELDDRQDLEACRRGRPRVAGLVHIRHALQGCTPLFMGIGEHSPRHVVPLPRVADSGKRR